MWNRSVIDGPIPIVLESSPYIDQDGIERRDVVGFADGYHINIPRMYMTPDLAPFERHPKRPRVEFFGEPTTYLRFTDESEARAYLSQYWIEVVDNGDE